MVVVVWNLIWVVDFVELVVLEESAMSDQFCWRKNFQLITFVLNAGDTGHFCDATGPESRVRTM